MPERIYSIYKIANGITGASYTGFTGRPPETRRNEHWAEWMWNRPFNRDKPLYRALRKYGVSNFCFEVVYQSMEEEHCLEEMEPYFIKFFRSHISEGGYNLTWGGRSAGDAIARRWEGNTVYRRKGLMAAATSGAISKQKWLDGDVTYTALMMANFARGTPAARQHNSLHWIVTPPTGIECEIVNLHQFCLEHGLDFPCMRKVANGQRPHHKGWTCRKSQTR